MSDRRQEFKVKSDEDLEMSNCASNSIRGNENDLNTVIGENESSVVTDENKNEQLNSPVDLDYVSPYSRLVDPRLGLLRRHSEMSNGANNSMSGNENDLNTVSSDNELTVVTDEDEIESIPETVENEIESIPETVENEIESIPETDEIESIPETDEIESIPETDEIENDLTLYNDVESTDEGDENDPKGRRNGFIVKICMVLLVVASAWGAYKLYQKFSI